MRKGNIKHEIKLIDEIELHTFRGYMTPARIVIAEARKYEKCCTDTGYAVSWLNNYYIDRTEYVVTLTIGVQK